LSVIMAVTTLPMEVIMLDTAFLRSLGIREEMLPPPPEPQAGGTGGNLPPALPTAGPRGVPAELLTLSDVELEKLLKEVHSRKNPYVYWMPDGIHQAAVYPDKVLGGYDLEFTAQEFINLVALARDPDLEGMLAYKSKHGPWHSVAPNPSQEVKDLLLGLNHDDRSTRTTQTERRS
jgi:hypothetical protein